MKKIIYIFTLLILLKIFFTFLDDLKNIKDYFSNTFIKETLTFYIISIDDSKHNITFEGNINDTISVKIPYKIDKSKKINLEAYEETVILNEKNSKEKEKNVKLIFSYPEQLSLTGEGYIDAILKIDDKESNIPDKIFKTRQLQIDDENEYILAEFIFPRNLKYKQYGVLQVKVISGIKDRMFHSLEHSKRNQKYIYYPIVSPLTGKIWLNNNLGSNYSNINNVNWNKNPFQQAKSILDEDAYGNLFQWGRKSDGHELRINYNNIKYTNSKSDNPNHQLQIISNSYPYDWRINEDNSLWKDTKNFNNVCPEGWRVPTKKELFDEIKDNSIEDNYLKLTLGGYKLRNDNFLFSEKLYGAYWTNEISDSYANFLLIGNGFKQTSIIYKSAAFSVRCIKD